MKPITEHAEVNYKVEVEIQFGGINATNVSVVTGTAISCTPPAQTSASQINVVVRVKSGV